MIRAWNERAEEKLIMVKLLDIKLTKQELDAGEQAAIKAGYSPKNARRTASRLLRTPAIREELLKRFAEQKDGHHDAH